MTLRKILQKLSPEKVSIWGLILLGLVLRLRQYLIGRSLWLDEAMLALNIVRRDYAGLWKTLDYNQGAPVAFLLVEKLVITLLGNHEATLRLFPFLAGCAALPLFALGLRQALGKAGVLLATVLFALGVPLVYYASEVKQYSSDVFFTVLLLWLAGRIIVEPGEPDGRDRGHKHLLLAAVGALALWFSHPATFVIAAIGATLLLNYALQKDAARLKQFAGVIGLWIVSFGALYLVSLRGLASNQFLHDYWAVAFMPQPPWSNPGWFVITLSSTIRTPIGLGTAWILPPVLMLTGLIYLLRTRWQFGALFGLTLAGSLAASELGIYPFAGRMILFSVPIFLALLAAGVEAVAGLFRQAGWMPGRLHAIRLGWIVGLVLAILLVYQPLTLAFENFSQPDYGEHIRPSMAFLRVNYRPNDKIYVYYWALPAFRYYAPLYGFAGLKYTVGHNDQDNPQAILAEISRLRGNSRVWILFSHVYEQGGLNQMNYVLDHLDVIGERKRSFIDPGTSVYLYLYDLSDLDIPLPP